MTNQPLVSVIMPVYGVEDYVGKAIESIQNQTYKNFEFFCVDDGTKDRSGEICDEYAKNDNRIIVIHKGNGGAPTARNVAIDQAKGKYFYFMDSDDWTEPTMLEDMVVFAEENNLQLVVSGYYIDTYYSDTNKFVQEQGVEDIIYDSQQAFREDAYRLFDQNLLYTPWNKLYDADYIRKNKLYFPQTFWDDFPFNLSVIKDVERVGVLSKKYYHFIRKRQESETAKYRPEMFDKREEEQTWMEDLYNHWQIASPEVDEFLARRYIERIIGCIENITNKGCNEPTLIKLKSIRNIIKSDRVQRAVKIAEPNSNYMAIMLIPIRLKFTFLTYLEGKVISFIKTHSTRVFATLKANR